MKLGRRLLCFVKSLPTPFYSNSLLLKQVKKTFYFHQFHCYSNLSTMACKGPITYDYGTFLVELVPALQDNYMYVVIDKSSNIAAAVDPVEPSKILQVVASRKANLKYVLTTHHHWDHAGGNLDLKKEAPHVEIFGGGDNVPGYNKILKDKDTFSIGDDISVKVIATPCHTKTSICYHLQDKKKTLDIVFTGDTLFIAGSGKFFEGDGADMNKNLNVKLSALPDTCKIFCGHEYTVSNLLFAKHIEPQNAKIQDKLVWAQEKRAKLEPTVPSTIGEEKETNPFMRIHLDHFRALGSHGDDLNQIMDIVRDKKNNFKP